MHDSAFSAVALVTGGATGIGRATCYELARRGVTGVVLAWSTSERDARTTTDRLHELGCTPLAIRCDLRSKHAPERLVDEAITQFGRLDIVVNCAATSRAVPFTALDRVTDSDWRSTYELNTVTPFRIACAAEAALRASHGSIVNVASASAERAAGSSIPYSVSKAALLQLTRCLALAMSPEVRVNSVSPGATKSRWMEDLIGVDEAREQHRAEIERTPLGRVGEPEDIAAVIADVAQSNYLTGQNIVVDGGRTIVY